MEKQPKAADFQEGPQRPLPIIRLVVQRGHSRSLSMGSFLPHNWTIVKISMLCIGEDAIGLWIEKVA